MGYEGNGDQAVVESISAVTLKAQLNPPVQIGDRYLTHREYVVVRVRTTDGVEGWAYGLSRNGPVAEAIRFGLAGVYEGTRLGDRQDTFWNALRSSPASYGSGIGLRALSLIDLAIWDASGKALGIPVSEMLGGANTRTPAACIVGYPPNNMDPDQCAAEVAELRSLGFNKFKAPISSDHSLSVAQMQSRRRVAPDAWLALDAAWTFSDADSASGFLRRIEDLDIGWFEDVFLPGDIESLEDLSDKTSVRIAMGDDQADAYYPTALIRSGAVDVLRFDITCMGGVTRGIALVRAIVEAGLEPSPHIFAPVHSQFLGGLGMDSIACEWTQPGSGVDPYTESLAPPVIAADGYAEAAGSLPGFGALVNEDWILAQSFDDPSRVFSADGKGAVV